ncbi:S-layer homology domain-containing protein [Desulfuribacillus alkaliarsenatis]|uniref:SLH domain-containing protein n=1 Tax=Desulfuribacillus alkaliarsenatis TaxID=766136 RepID=A0A1E5G681_9FIRM|nr:S-layer homology domain-containing protein [Desulfuribacillus alkaliarsenatis]OEF98690.1 hypothetical protein BHF68_03245 [Desulfuribacillus alkaliarsenatis]
MSKRNPLLLIMAIIVIMVLLHTFSVAEALELQHEFHSSEGIVYKSYSKEWATEVKLKALHTELLRNQHGEEIRALSAVIIYPDFPDHNRNKLGSYQLAYRLDNGKYEVLSDNIISLYGGNTFTNVEDVARTLSRQYGKHFTQYHILKNENILLSNQGYNSKYAQLRQLNNIDQRSNSKWNIEELAADDYVQLFGSPLARKHYLFSNMIDEFEKSPTTWQQPMTARHMFNLMPQQNLNIPLALEVSGLREYFIQLGNLTGNRVRPLINKPTLYVQEIKRVTNQNNSLQLTFAWDTVANPSQRLNYTLVTYGDFDAFPFPIVTYQNNSSSENQLTARYGTVVARDQNMIYFNKHLGFYGKKTFRLFVSDMSGNMISSNELTLDLSQNPINIINNNLQITDVSNDHWAYDNITIANGYRFIRGYPDLTFRPNQYVTRAELLAILNRVNQFSKLTNSQTQTQIVGGSHWGVPVLNEAISSNIVRTEHYGAQYELFVYDEYITREEVAMLSAQLLRAKGFQQLPNARNFTDIQNSSYRDEIRLISSYQIVQGFPDNSFRPKEFITRAQATVIANQLFQQIRNN